MVRSPPGTTHLLSVSAVAWPAPSLQRDAQHAAFTVWLPSPRGTFPWFARVARPVWCSFPWLIFHGGCSRCVYLFAQCWTSESFPALAVGTCAVTDMHTRVSIGVLLSSLPGTCARAELLGPLPNLCLTCSGRQCFLLVEGSSQGGEGRGQGTLPVLQPGFLLPVSSATTSHWQLWGGQGARGGTW